MIRRALAIALMALLVATRPADAATAQWSISDLEGQLMCPVCHTLLNDSQSSAADRIRHIVRDKHSAGWSEQRTRDYLVAQYGEEILAAPPKRGFDLLAWLVPAAVLLGGGGVAVALARAWARGRGGGPPDDHPPPDDAMDRRIDADLAREEV
jgi:cytochrome c-type biogenesis protein CcmH